MDAFGVVPSAGRIRDYFEVDAIYAAGIGLSTLIATISGGSTAALRERFRTAHWLMSVRLGLRHWSNSLAIL